MGKLHALISDKSGSEVIEFIYAIFALCLIICGGLFVIEYALQANAVSYAAKRVSRYVEVSGYINEEELNTQLLPKLLGNADDIGAEIKIVVPDSHDWYNQAKKQIQLRGRFTVYVKADYTLPLMNGMDIKLPIVAITDGQSEIYWKAS